MRELDGSGPHAGEESVLSLPNSEDLPPVAKMELRDAYKNLGITADRIVEISTSHPVTPLIVSLRPQGTVDYSYYYAQVRYDHAGTLDELRFGYIFSTDRPLAMPLIQVKPKQKDIERGKWHSTFETAQSAVTGVFPAVGVVEDTTYSVFVQYPNTPFIKHLSTPTTVPIDALKNYALAAQGEPGNDVMLPPLPSIDLWTYSAAYTVPDLMNINLGEDTLLSVTHKLS